MKMVKVRHEKGFTLLDNSIFREKDLSLKAKGLFCLMWSLPDDWQYSVSGLAALGSDGKDAVRAAMIELGNLGYMARSPRRKEDGTLDGMDYLLYEQPWAGNPTAVPLAGFPTMDNPTQLNTKEESTKEGDKEECNEETKRRTKRFIPPTVEQVADYCLERRNGISAQSFVDFYTSKGWMVGKSPMKDWKAAVRTWESARKLDTSLQPKGKELRYD